MGKWPARELGEGPCANPFHAPLAALSYPRVRRSNLAGVGTDEAPSGAGDTG